MTVLLAEFPGLPGSSGPGRVVGQRLRVISAVCDMRVGLAAADCLTRYRRTHHE
jgi:hypothetical protein